MRIFLTGLSGTGKSSWGKQLSAKLGYSFLDLDSEIEKELKTNIPSLFEERGEEFFRQIEAQLLRRTEDKNDLVIACGGGTPCFENNMEWMRSKGLVLMLSLPIPTIAQRLKNSHQRPLVPGTEVSDIAAKIKEQWEERKEFYQQAHLQLDVMSMNAAKWKSILAEIEKTARDLGIY